MMDKLSSQLEAILLVANKPLSLKELGSAVEAKPAEIEAALNSLAASYEEEGRGLRLLFAAGTYQFSSAGEHSNLVRSFLKSENSGELSQPSLEALTIVAYRGPVSKLELERIRGVNCSLIVRNLLLRGLIEENFDKVKNENYYQVTLDFLRFLGLNRVQELPDYERLHQPEELVAVLSADERSC